MPDRRLGDRRAAARPEAKREARFSAVPQRFMSLNEGIEGDHQSLLSGTLNLYHFNSHEQNYCWLLSRSFLRIFYADRAF
jgi:hypothetical protein